jgi:hypothetical protein
VSSSPRHQKLTLNPFGFTLQTGYPHNTSLVLYLCVCKFIYLFKKDEILATLFFKGKFCQKCDSVLIFLWFFAKKRKKALTHYVTQHPSMYHPFGNPIWLSYGWTTTELPTTSVNILEMKIKKETIIFLYSWLPTYWKLS